MISVLALSKLTLRFLSKIVKKRLMAALCSLKAKEIERHLDSMNGERIPVDKLLTDHQISSRFHG